MSMIDGLFKKNLNDSALQSLQDHRQFLGTSNEISLTGSTGTVDFAIDPDGTKPVSIEMTSISGNYIKLKIEIFEGSDFTVASGTDIPIQDRNRESPLSLPGTFEKDPTVADPGSALDNGVVIYGTTGQGNSDAVGINQSQPTIKLDISQQYIIRVSNLDSAAAEISAVFSGLIG